LGEFVFEGLCGVRNGQRDSVLHACCAANLSDKQGLAYNPIRRKCGARCISGTESPSQSE
jgi:hypothetical protein